MLTLLQNVAVLGFLGLVMTMVVTGRGIDNSLVAALTAPPEIAPPMVLDGYPLSLGMAKGSGIWAMPRSIETGQPPPRGRSTQTHEEGEPP